MHFRLQLPHSSAASPSGPEIVLNLGTVTPGEQITIGLSNASNGTEQLTIGVAQQNQSPEQITLNLNQNSNQQIILNLFNSTAASTAREEATAASQQAVRRIYRHGRYRNRHYRGRAALSGPRKRAESMRA